MKLSGKLNLLLIPVLLALLLGGAAGIYWSALAGKQDRQDLERAVTAQQTLQELAHAADIRIARLQTALLQDTLPEQPGTDTAELSPQYYFKQYRENYLSATNERADLDELALTLDELDRLSVAITTRLSGPKQEPEAALEARLKDATALDKLTKGISQLTSMLAKPHAQTAQTVRSRVNGLNLPGIIVIGILTLVGVLFTVISLLSLKSTLAQPLTRMVERIQDGQPHPESESELGTIGSHLNYVQQRDARLRHTLERIAEGDLLPNFDKTQYEESVAIALATITRKLDELGESKRHLESDVNRQKLLASEAEKKAALAASELSHAKAKLSAVESTLAIAELDDSGKLVYADRVFSQLTGYTSDELKGRDYALLATGSHEGEVLSTILSAVRGGKTWYGVMQNQNKQGGTFWLASAITPLATNGDGKQKYLLAGYEISTLKHQESELRRSLQTVSDDLEKYKTSISRLQNEQHNLVTNYQSQKQLEYRLMQQQSALQELTRNADLKEGNVREALRSVTETTAYALDEERVGLWLFIENGGRLRCLDLYERTTLRHYDSTELRRDAYGAFFTAIDQEGVLAVEQALTDGRTDVLGDPYLKPAGVQSLLSAPIHLGGGIVGALMVERVGEPRSWTLDEQNFVMSVADVVSLALEQGNRRVMEEELRMTLEESQALEEELRQNAEEIEATNEEMRRTQAELRGQISALNNAAIVSETNPTGLITYANAEFAKLYGYEKAEVLGQNHSILKSGHHPPAFFHHLWTAISAGKVWKGEIKNKARNGSDLWVLLTITPVMGIDGKPYKFIGVGFNITAQKLQEEQIKAALDVAQQQQDMLRQNAEELEYANDEMRRTQIELAGQINALNNSSMVYETDMEGNITYVNEELLEVTGFSREDLIGHRYTIIKSGRQPDSLYQEQWRTVLNGKIWRGELEKKNKKGEYIWVMVTNTPVLDSSGEPIKSINVMFDVTAQKLQEFRLKKQQSSLLELTSNESVKEGRVEEAFELITRVGSETLHSSRAAIWLYEDGGTTIRCVATFPTEGHPHTVGTTLDKELFPVYFRTLERDRIIAANDAAIDPRTRELSQSLLSVNGISAVLDASIRQGGKTVGLISFEHREAARIWTLDEQSFATSLADTVSLVLEQKERLLTDKLKLAYTQLEEKSLEVQQQKAAIEEQAQFLTESIKYAKRIQTNILPAKEFIEAHIPNFFIVYRPRDIVGGDFYWFAAQGSKKVIVVADGTGHGVPGAFLTLIGYLLLNQIVNEKGITRPADILYHLHIGVRTALKQDEEGSESRDGMDVTIVTLDTANNMAQFAGANLPFNYYQDWELHVIKPDKYSIGGEQMEEERVFTNHEVQLKPGDGIYLYTDGFVDQLGGPDEKRFSTRRFRDLVLRTQHESMATQRALVNLEWKEWKDDREQLDDVTVFGMRIEESYPN